MRCFKKKFELDYARAVEVSLQNPFTRAELESEKQKALSCYRMGM